MTTVLGASVVLTSAFVVAIVFVAAAPGGLALTGVSKSILTCVLAVLVMGLSFFFAGIRRPMRVQDYLGISPVSWRVVASALALTVVLGIGYGWVGIAQGRSELSETLIRDYQGSGLLLVCSAYLLAAPISEEVFFRGFLYAGFRSSFMGGVGATVLTSALWAGMHFQYDAFTIFSLFGFGLLLGAVRDISGSIIPTVLMHMLVNLIVLVQVVYWAG